MLGMTPLALKLVISVLGTSVAQKSELIQYNLNGITYQNLVCDHEGKMKKIIILALIGIAVSSSLVGCGSSTPKVTVIGNSSSQEKMATPAPSK
jgi:multisubunit Na+/H+ antiporter MnhC subunit